MHVKIPWPLTIGPFVQCNRHNAFIALFVQPISSNANNSIKHQSHTGVSILLMIIFTESMSLKQGFCTLADTERRCSFAINNLLASHNHVETAMTACR